MSTLKLAISEISSPIGPLAIMATEYAICHLEFGSLIDNEAGLMQWAKQRLNAAEADIEVASARSHPILAEAERQLERYFAGELRAFDVPLQMHGTEFQLRVWEALRQIPYGETRSYKQIAEAIGKPAAVRAVGGANNKNPIPIMTPCHRVIGADGRMVGFGGGLAAKTALLELETN
ncbi:methylated-DNA--[protein]-cysteine S-methyltransferase [Paenibacillus sp. LHD-117]|uniref:methylated-DNA--[protein]-cysteine S-methyltransferase n=1 Tax=Paenibacillus sp. LHD-117 TaxID=3071412 RepID=UPI0027E18DAE|nr:methylated-DNA--[protein]-cysteine S-methyltransferase [Paenibacillus sp. LHD-117]MDQ6423561.1 methylated-DNA--[protein]-cysteine S-methyltransferase [Paenibacillus sp. LHD-117]